MNKSLVVVGLLLTALTCGAQAPQYKTVQLKPITQEGWKYFYDLRKVSGPAALEVPLLAVNDVEVTRYLRSYRSWNAAASAVTLVPLIYILSLPRNQYVDPNTFWWILGGSLAAQLGMTAISHIKLGKAVDKYNEIILQPSGRSLGLEVIYRF